MATLSRTTTVRSTLTSLALLSWKDALSLDLATTTPMPTSTTVLAKSLAACAQTAQATLSSSTCTTHSVTDGTVRPT